MTRKTATGMSEERRGLIADMLERCNAAIDTCFGLDPETYSIETVLDGVTTGARLIKTSLSLAAALDGERAETVHRIIVEHRGGEDSPEKIPKTIKRVPRSSGHKIE